MYSVYPLLLQGKFSQALARLDTLIAASEPPAVTSAAGPVNYLSRLLCAMILEEIGGTDSAIAELQGCLALSSRFSLADSLEIFGYYVELLEKNGNRSQVDSLIKERLKESPGSGLGGRIGRYMNAMAAFGRGEYSSAAKMLENDTLDRDDFFGLVNLARAYLGSGRLADADSLLRRLTDSYTSRRAFHGIESVKLHYYLGQVLEQMKRPQEAIEQYDRFLQLWRSADKGIDAVDDAKKRVERLRS